jgi:hypothetical protein
LPHGNRPGRARAETGAAAAAPLPQDHGHTKGAGLPGKNDRGFRTVFRADPAENVMMGKAVSGNPGLEVPGGARLDRGESPSGTAFSAGAAKTAGPSRKINHRVAVAISNKNLICATFKTGAAAVALCSEFLYRQDPGRTYRWRGGCGFSCPPACQESLPPALLSITIEKKLETFIGQKRSQVHSSSHKTDTENQKLSDCCHHLDDFFLEHRTTTHA